MPDAGNHLMVRATKEVEIMALDPRDLEIAHSVSECPKFCQSGMD